MLGLTQTATVYTPNGTDGGYTVVAASALPCRLVLAQIATDMGGGRAEQTGARLLLWSPSYSMPATAQVLLDGARWNVEPGTIAPVRALSGAIDHWRAQVTEAE